MTMNEVKNFLITHKANPDEYCIGEPKMVAWEGAMLYEDKGKFIVSTMERGIEYKPKSYDNENDACIAFLELCDDICPATKELLPIDTNFPRLDSSGIIPINDKFNKICAY